MLSLAKVLSAAIVARSLFFGTPTVNGFNTGYDRKLSRDDEGYSNRLGGLEHKQYEHEDDTLFIRKLLQTSGTNEMWAPPQKLTLTNGNNGDQFGRSVALDNTMLMVGAPTLDGSSRGSVYMYEKSNVQGIPWSPLPTLTARNGADGDYFGCSIAFDGTILMVGAHSKDLPSPGSVYVYEKSNAQGITWSPLTTLTPTNGDDGDKYGWSVALYDTTLVVGAPENKDNGLGPGSVYVYEKPNVQGSPWSPLTTLTPENGASQYDFGWSIAVESNTLVVGAPSAGESSSGSVYVYEKPEGSGSQWSLKIKLTPGSGASGEEFGKSVALDGTRIVVGAPEARGSDETIGSVYVYERSKGSQGQWSLAAKLIAEDRETSRGFGESVALNGGILVVGDPTAYVGEDPTGAVYVYERSEGTESRWSQLKKLFATDGKQYDDFGTSLSLDGNTLVVGAPGCDNCESPIGSVYIFQSEALLPPSSSINKVIVPALTSALGSILYSIFLMAATH